MCDSLRRNSMPIIVSDRIVFWYVSLVTAFIYMLVYHDREAHYFASWNFEVVCRDIHEHYDGNAPLSILICVLLLHHRQSLDIDWMWMCLRRASFRLQTQQHDAALAMHSLTKACSTRHNLCIPATPELNASRRL
jgi:hypothetical protein